jgi:thioredoxin:protein disulfide reductase
MLTVTSQGCADAGVCYPPQRHQFSLERGSPATVQPIVAAGTTTFSSGPQPIPAPAVSASGKISDLIRRTQ